MLNEVKDHISEFILGGRCKFIVYNEETKNQRKYYMKALWYHRGRVTDQYYEGATISWYKVYDTEDKKSKFLGKLLPSSDTYVFQREMSADVEASRNFAWVWHIISGQKIPPNIHILHVGSCSICARPLTDAESLARGMGPICAKRKYNITSKS